MTDTTDFLVANHGSICILTAVTESARAWVSEYLPDDRQVWGPNGSVIKPRYMAAIVIGIEADDLTLAAD